MLLMIEQRHPGFMASRTVPRILARHGVRGS